MISADSKKIDAPTRKFWPDAINFAKDIKILILATKSGKALVISSPEIIKILAKPRKLLSFFGDWLARPDLKTLKRFRKNLESDKSRKTKNVTGNKKIGQRWKNRGQISDPGHIRSGSEKMRPHSDFTRALEI